MLQGPDKGKAEFAPSCFVNPEVRFQYFDSGVRWQVGRIIWLGRENGEDKDSKA